MKSTKQTTIQEEVSSNNGFPSADLINFRFDQNDKILAALDAKVDRFLTQVVTSKELADAKVESVAQHLTLSNRIDKLESWNDWAMRLVLGAVILAVLATIGIKTFIT